MLKKGDLTDRCSSVAYNVCFISRSKDLHIPWKARPSLLEEKKNVENEQLAEKSYGNHQVMHYDSGARFTKSSKLRCILSIGS